MRINYFKKQLTKIGKPVFFSGIERYCHFYLTSIYDKSLEDIFDEKHLESNELDKSFAIDKKDDELEESIDNQEIGMQ